MCCIFRVTDDVADLGMGCASFSFLFWREALMFSSSCLNFCDVKCVGTGSQTVQRMASSLPPSLSFLPEAQPARAVIGVQFQVFF